MDTPDAVNNRLEDLSAQLLSREALLTSEQIGNFRVAIARMEGKLDAALAVREDFEEYKEKTSEAIVNLGLQVSKLESFRGVMLWIAGLLSGVIVAVISALAYYVINHP